MTTYTYTAVARNGQARHGTLEAESVPAAVSQLRARELLAVDVTVVGSPWRDAHYWRRVLGTSVWKRLRRADVLNLTQELSVLLTAGLTVDRALAVLRGTLPGAGARIVIEDLIARIRNGGSFADALAAHPREFGVEYETMVRAGEASGSLAVVLGRLYTYLERRERLRQRLRSAMIYPSIVAGMVLATLLLVVTTVLPRFERLFADSNVSLPWATRAVLAFGRFVTSYGLAVALGLALVTGFAWQALQRPGIGARVDRWLLRSRLFLGLQRVVPAAQYLRATATLIESGVPLPRSLAIASGLLRNREFARLAREMQQRVQGGQPLSAELARRPAFPPIAAHLARVGEESGELGKLLDYGAELLDRDAESLLNRLLALFVPLVTIGMGALVAALVASVLVGVLSINDLAF